jgi:hypothetical protein
MRTDEHRRCARWLTGARCGSCAPMREPAILLLIAVAAIVISGIGAY